MESTHYLRVHTGHLRQKLENDPAQPRHILTETGVAREVERRAPDNDAQITGDAILLAVLLRNLLDNAVRYTPAGGDVDVSVRRSNGTVSLAVSDSGPGIPGQERGKVLDRFYRVLGSGEEGSGLGLSIVKRIADLHDATMLLSAGPGGGGLVVEVRFPAIQR